jgi:O-antigen/teichoic acid export membrane protein
MASGPVDAKLPALERDAALKADILDTAQAGPSVIRGSLLRLIGQVVGMLVTVVSSAIVIRHLGVVNTGRYVTVTALVVIVASISDLGLSAVGVREYSLRNRIEGHRLLRNLLGIRLAFITSGVVIAVIFAAGVDYTRAMVIGTALAGAGMVLYVVQQSLAIPLQVKLRFGWVSLLALLSQVGVAVGAALLAITGAGLLPFFALQLPVMVPLIALTLIVGGRESRALPAASVQEWRQMMAQILTYSAAVVLSVLYFRISQIMVSLISSGTQTGYFGVSFRILDAFTIVPPILVSTALPVLARAARDDAERFAYASLRLVETMILVGVGVAVVIFLGAGFLVHLVAGAGFGPSVEVMRILAFALIGTFVIAARGYALLALGRMRAMLIANALAFSVVLGAGVPLIIAHGALGAAIAMTSAELVLGLSYEVALTRGRPELRAGSGFVVRVLVAALLACVPVVVLGLPSFTMAVIGAAVYGAAALALGVVPTELRDALRSVRTPAAGGVEK